MGSGKNKQAENNQNALAASQLKTNQEMLGFFKDRTAKMDTLQQPAIARFQKIASGDPTAMISASAVPLGNIENSYRASKENIYDSVPSGAAREFALAGLSRDKGANISGTLNQGYLNAFNALLGIGKDQGAFGLQEAGAGITSGQAAGQTNQSLMDASAQRKASQMGLFSSLAGAAGTAAGGGVFGKL